MQCSYTLGSHELHLNLNTAMIYPSEIQSLQKFMIYKRSVFETLVRKICHTMFWLFGVFCCLHIYQIMVFQVILPLDICTSSKFIWVNWICPNKFSPSVSLQAFSLGWADCWALTPLRDKGGHTAKPTRSLGRATTSAECLPFLIGIFCWGGKALTIAASSFSLPPPQHSSQAQQQTQHMRTAKAALQSSFLPSYHFCPYSTPPGYLHFSCSAVIIIRQEKGIKAFCNTSQ